MSNPKIDVVIGGPGSAPCQYKSKILKANIPFASQIDKPDMKYVIKYDFDLKGSEVHIPSNCILEFDGGSINNGTIVLNNTNILPYYNDLSEGNNLVVNGNPKEGVVKYENHTLYVWNGTIWSDFGNGGDLDPVIARIDEVSQTVTEQGNEIDNLSTEVNNLEAVVGTGGSVDTRINSAKNQIIGDAGVNYNTLGKLEDRIQEEASARATAISNETARAQAAENTLDAKIDSSVTTINSKIAEDITTEKNRAMGEEELLRQAYEAISQFEPIIGALPASGVAGKVYRVPGDSSYADYMWDGSSFVKMAQYDNAIDDKSIEGSENLVKSGGVSGEFADAYTSIYSPEDLYSYTPQTGVINTNNKWDTEHYNHLIIPLTGISKVVYTTTSSEYGVVIAFLKTYNITETNPDFSALYPSRIYVDADKSVKYDVPVDAAYLYLANRTSYVNDVRTIEELRLIKKQDAVEDRVQVKINTVAEEVDEVVGNFDKMMNNVTENLDITDLPDFGYIIVLNNTTKAYYYSRTTGSTLAEGRVIEIPPLVSYVIVEGHSSYATFVAFLKDTVASPGAAPHFADDYDGRIKINKKTVRKFKLNSSCKYLYFAKTSKEGVDMQPANVSVEYTMSGSADAQKKELNILFIGSSGEMDMVAYVPPILKEVLYDYDITVADMYSSGAQASDYVEDYKKDRPCSRFNMWTPDSVSWPPYTRDTKLEDALEMKHWNLIVMKGSVTSCRQLMRIIQSLVTYPVTFATVSNIPRVYDNPWESVTNSAKSRCRGAGFVGWIPVGTGMQNARSNDKLKKTGSISCPEPTEYTIPAGKYLYFTHTIRKAESGIPAATVKATRLSGNGTVDIHVLNPSAQTPIDNIILTLSDNEEHSAVSSIGTTHIKIVNNGSTECTVRLEDSQSLGNYMLYEDNQHTQSGIPILISSYVIALKILDWTGNANRGICGSSFLPTQENLVRLGVTNANGEAGGLGHGYSCGVDNYIGSDGNTYDRSQLTLFDGTLYVTTTVFDNTPDTSSIRADIDTNNPVNYNNIYAAQEVAMLSVNYPDELTDCSNVVIDVPGKTE